ncbi:MAG: LacI family DNA-binding transcriptional regulator [Opitutaceae bacterium]|nr:LacI family DNA-binding transcriptional regulator [Opitutaceae bacterium]
MPERVSYRATRAGIVQIATRLSVSPSTVSRALRPETAHLVRADRRKEILDLAERLHFSPNPGARMLRKGVNASLTVVVPFDENIFFSEFYGRFLSGTLHAAAARGWDVHICTLRRQPGSDLREALQHLSLDTSGLIYLAEPLSPADVQHLSGYRRPLVLTKSVLPPGVPVKEIGVPVVGVDNLSGAQTAASLLLQLGHVRIGLLLGPSGSRDAQERKKGYLDVLDRVGARPRPEWIIEGSFSAETGRAGAAALLATADRPTALCCASDEIAFGAINAARAAGLRCPEDVSVMGFDDGPWAAACWPALTTVRQPLADVAERAVSFVVEAANHPGSSITSPSSDLSAALVIRDSTRALGSPR